MKNLLTLFSILILIFASQSLNSRPYRVAQIPNGGSFNCATCHNSPSGGSRNPFGKAIEQNFLQGGNVVWGAELASLDSDGDGFTNGEELLDPDGTWSEGSENPGGESTTGNPGDPTSRPDITNVFSNFENNADNSIEIYSVFPNPSYSDINLTYKLNKPGSLSIKIYDYSGILVNEFDRGFVNSGVNEFNWDRQSFNGYELSNGTYFIYINLDNSVIMQKVILM